MAYTTPFTATPLQIITASGWNTSARDNIEYLKGRAGTIAFEAGATFQGNVGVNGNLNITATGGQLNFASGVAVKEDYTGFGRVITGVEATTLYWQAEGNYSWRNESGVQRMQLTTGATPALTVNGNTVWHSGNDGSASGLDAGLLEGSDKAAVIAAAVAAVPANFEVATNTYTGDGTNSRSIPVPFVPNWAMIAGGNSDATVEQYILFNVLGSARDSNAGNTTYSTGARLSAGNAELVVSAAGANVSGKSYWWVAMR